LLVRIPNFGGLFSTKNYKELNYTILSLEEAAKRFSTHHFSFFDKQYNKNKVVKIVETDALLPELQLDFLLNKDIAAYIFMGNLTVTGNILNEITDFGVALIAFKDVKAKNIAVCGSEIYIGGNLEIEGLICGCANHGKMAVYGDVKARYILNDDYTFLFYRRVDAIVLNDVKSGYHKINNWKESLDNRTVIKSSNIDYWDVLNPSIYDVYNNCFDFEALIKTLNKGDELFINNKEKLKQLNFNVHHLTDLFRQLKIKDNLNRFGFGVGFQVINIIFEFYRHVNDYYLDIKLERKEVFKYEFKNNKFSINHLTPNGLSQVLTKENDFKNYYRALYILVNSRGIVQDFIDRKDKILRSTQNIIAPLSPSKFPFIYQSFKNLYENPIAYYNDNKAYFDNLYINYLNWSFQKQAALNILKQSEMVLIIHGDKPISTALNDLTDWFKKRGFDIETDWKARGLNVNRRIEYFSKDVLIINEICKEKNIPLSILDFSWWLNDRFIVFFPVKNEEKELFLEWLNDLELINN
jgi:hypothetical protein